MTWQKDDEDLFKELKDFPDIPMRPEAQQKILGELIKVEQLTMNRPFSRVNPRRMISMASAGVAGIALALGVWTVVLSLMGRQAEEESRRLDGEPLSRKDRH